MKIIKIFFLSLLALILVLTAGVSLYLQTLDTDRYLSLITNKASLMFGRPVSIGHLGLGVSLQGVSLDAGPLVIMDDPDFTSQPFIKIDKVSVGIDLSSLIFHRKISITQIVLHSPQLHLIRDQDGKFNISSFIQERKTEVVAVPARPLDGIAAIPGPRQSFVRSIQTIIIQDGAVSYIDQNQSFPLDIWLTDINGRLNDLSLSKPIGISLEGALCNDVPNVRIGAMISLDALNRSVLISGLKLNVGLSQLDTNKLKGVSPHVMESPYYKNVTGTVHLNMPRLMIEASRDIVGNGDLHVSGGTIKDLNIMKSLLSNSLGGFGWVEGNIESLLKGQLKDKLDTKDTVIENADVDFSMHDRAIFIDDSLVKTNIIELKAQGSIDDKLNTDLQTTLHLNEDLSDALVGELSGLKYLLDDSKRIVIGASVQGVMPHLKYKPNKEFKKKSKKALIEEGGNFLNSLFK